MWAKTAPWIRFTDFIAVMGQKRYSLKIIYGFLEVAKTQNRSERFVILTTKCSSYIMYLLTCIFLDQDPDPAQGDARDTN